MKPLFEEEGNDGIVFIFVVGLENDLFQGGTVIFKVSNCHVDNTNTYVCIYQVTSSFKEQVSIINEMLKRGCSCPATQCDVDAPTAISLY